MLALLVGVAAGFLLAIPPGPVAAILVRRALSGKSGILVSAGASVVDIFYVLAAAFFSAAIIDILNLKDGLFLFIFQLICVVVLLALGIKYLTHPLIKASHKKEIESDAPFFQGILASLVNLSSPSLIPALILTIGLLHAWGWLDGSVINNLAFSVGFGVGTMAWLVIIYSWIKKNHRRFSPRANQAAIQAAGVLLIISGVLLGFKILL